MLYCLDKKLAIPFTFYRFIRVFILYYEPVRRSQTFSVLLKGEEVYQTCPLVFSARRLLLRNSWSQRGTSFQWACVSLYTPSSHETKTNRKRWKPSRQPSREYPLTQTAHQEHVCVGKARGSIVSVLWHIEYKHNGPLNLPLKCSIITKTYTIVKDYRYAKVI